jgi:hypothetical protein
VTEASNKPRLGLLRPCEAEAAAHGYEPRVEESMGYTTSSTDAVDSESLVIRRIPRHCF